MLIALYAKPYTTNSKSSESDYYSVCHLRTQPSYKKTVYAICLFKSLTTLWVTVSAQLYKIKSRYDNH